MKPAVSVVIPNWNGKKHLQECLASLSEQTILDYEIILVDNGSQDGSQEYVRTMFPNVKLITFDKNRGISAANNAGIEAAHAEIVVVMNNDTSVETTFLQNVLRAFEENPDISFCAMKTVQDGGIINAIGDAEKFVKVSSPAIPRRVKDGPEWNVARDVFGAGPCMAYRTSLFIDVGLFDEDLFAFYEDVDMAFRAHLAGHRAIYWPHAVMRHKVEGTLKREHPMAMYYRTRNGIWILLKNMPAVILARYFHKLVGPILKTWLRDAIKSLLRFKKDELVTVRIGARRDAVRGFDKMYGKRRYIQGHRKIKPNELLFFLR